jgi:hypothetical protein
MELDGINGEAEKDALDIFTLFSVISLNLR